MTDEPNRDEEHEATLRLTHPALDFNVDVRLRPYESRTWVAAADLAGEQDTGMDRDPRKAIEKALESRGPPHRRRR